MNLWSREIASYGMCFVFLYYCPRLLLVSVSSINYPSEGVVLLLGPEQHKWLLPVKISKIVRFCLDIFGHTISAEE